MNLLPPPGPQRTRQLAMLGVLVVLLLGVGWWFYGSDAPAAVPATTTSNAQTTTERGGTGKTGPAALPQALELASLDPDGDPSPEASARNPFRFGEPPKPPPPPYVPPPPVSLAEQAAMQAALQAPPPVPAIPLKLEGLETMIDGVRRATLKDPATDRQFQGVEGSVIDGRYRLEKIGLESVVMSYLDGSGRRTIPKGQ